MYWKGRKTKWVVPDSSGDLAIRRLLDHQNLLMTEELCKTHHDNNILLPTVFEYAKKNLEKAAILNGCTLMVGLKTGTV